MRHKYFYKLFICLFIFFNIGYLLKSFFTAIGFDLTTFNITDLVYLESLAKVILLIIVILCYKDTLNQDYHSFNKYCRFNIKKCLYLSGIFFLVKIGAAFIVTIFGVIFGINVGQSNNQELVQTFALNLPIMMLISSVILAPILEEVIFRLGFKKIIKNPTAFILISGLVFGLIHVYPTSIPFGASILQVIPYVVMGFALAYIYERWRNIYYVIFVHALNNLVSMIIILFIL